MGGDRHEIRLSHPDVRAACVIEPMPELDEFYDPSSGTKRGVGNVDEECWVAVRVGLDALLDYLRKPAMCWNIVQWKVDGHLQRLKKEISVEASILLAKSNTSDSIQIIDGRHRLLALQILGAKDAVIMVPASQVELFTETFPIP